jgi:hypothetical protein
VGESALGLLVLAALAVVQPSANVGRHRLPKVVATEGREDLRVGEVEEVGVALADQGFVELGGDGDYRGKVGIGTGGEAVGVGDGALVDALDRRRLEHRASHLKRRGVGRRR